MMQMHVSVCLQARLSDESEKVYARRPRLLKTKWNKHKPEAHKKRRGKTGSQLIVIARYLLGVPQP